MRPQRSAGSKVVQGLVGHAKALELGYEGGKELFEDHDDQNCLLE